MIIISTVCFAGLDIPYKVSWFPPAATRNDFTSPYYAPQCTSVRLQLP